MAISMAVFGGDAFTQTQMIKAIDRRPYVPGMLQTIIPFEPVPVSTDIVYINSRKKYLNLIRSSQRGAPIEMGTPSDKDARPLKIPRFAKGDKIFAHELANVMPYEDETETDLAVAMTAQKLERLMDDAMATFEYQALGALNGILLDTDGSTVLSNFYTEFGISVPSNVDLQLDSATRTIGELREDIGKLLTLPIARASGAGNDPRFRLKGIAGDDFWFKMTGHPAISKTYEAQIASAQLRDERVWESYMFAGIEWWHYRGTDDGTTISIPSNTCKVFPVGVPGMWQHVMGPMNESMPLMGVPGRRWYPFMERDKSDKQQWVQPEIYAYPLFVNARPDLVLTATV